MWIVMTSSAKMPTKVRAPYRNVALVQLNQHYTARNLRPAMISAGARGVLQVRHGGHHHVGRTERGAYQRALAEAERRAVELNSAAPEAHGEMLMSWGGSA